MDGSTSGFETGGRRYADMQRRHYDLAPQTVEELVGWYAFHENVPYETLLLYQNGDLRRPLLSDPAGLTAFDFGCGEGRMIRRMSALFDRVDGADISERMTTAARERCPGSNIYLADGAGCGAAGTDAYDFAYSTICLQHIAVHSTRTAILRDMARVVRPGGRITVQLLFSRNYPHVFAGLEADGDDLIERYRRDGQHAGWFDDRYDAPGTNSDCDGVIGRNDLLAVIEDIGRTLANVSYWFHDISVGRSDPRTGAPEILSKTHPNCHSDDAYYGTHMLFVSGTV